ncbi:MAG: septal ring lytic transglycosylase RlpA family protein [Gammaproteobacteria bacterium]
MILWVIIVPPFDPNYQLGGIRMRLSERLVKTMLPIFLAFFCTFVHAKSTKSNASTAKKIGIASYYSDKFHGRRTASGERYNKNGLTAEHASLPFGTVLRVTNLKNNRSVKVRVNDRANRHNKRLVDLSKRAAKELGIIHAGLARVEIEVLSLGDS